MPKATLSFNLPEEQDQFDTAVKGLDRSIAITEVWNEVFRPARKHGYSDIEVQQLMDKIGVDAYRLVDLLGDKFIDIMRNRDIDF